jgi:general secretion pathway protein D
MTVKPTIHMDDDVTLKSKIDVTATAGNTNIGGITEPIITEKSIDHTIRLKNGEANLLGGILQHQTTTTISGWPGLAQLPLIKYLFSTQQKEVTDDEIVFLLIPHVVSAEHLTPQDLQEIDTGTGNSVEVRPIIRPLQVSDLQPAAPSQPAAGPAAQPPMNNPAPVAATGSFPPETTPGVPTPPPPANAAQATQEALASREKENNPQAAATLTLDPPQTTAKVGSSFKVMVNLAGGSDVFAAPMSVQYDASKLSLINVDADDPQHPNLLGKDGQAVALAHRDDGKGQAAIAVSRPPGTTGVSGSGTVCVLTFQAKAAGDASVAISRPVLRNAQQQAEPATGSQAVIHIQ